MTTTINKWFALTIVLTAPLLYVIDIFIINITIPTIQQNLNATDSEMQLVISSYLLGSASFLIIGGRDGDYLGRKKVFYWGMLLFTLTSAICGLCETASQLIISRFFQGISSAFMVTQSIVFIQILFVDAKERAKAIGWYGITLSIAAIIGQILGGFLAETDFLIKGWRLIFFINIPVGFISLWAIKKYLKETSKMTNIKFDYLGAVLLTIALGGIIYGITEGREQGWPLWSMIVIGISMTLFLLFLRHQKNRLKIKKEPFIDLNLFKQKEFNLGLLAVLFHFMLHTAYLLMIAVYLQNGLGLSALQCGIYFMPHALLFMLSSILASKLLVRYGTLVLQVGLFVILMSFILQLVFFGTHNNIFLSISLIGMYGFGNGMVLPFLLNIVLNSVSTDDAGTASGIFSTFQQTASALGISIIGGIFYSSLEANSIPLEYMESLHSGLLAGTFCLILAAIMIYFLPNSLKNNDVDVIH